MKRLLWPIVLLVIVAAGFAVAQVALIPPSTYHSWDEAVYASQFSSTVPAVTPSPHRAAGMSLLLAPVTLATASFSVIRCYLVALTSVALVAAFWPWLAVHRWVAPVAAGVFAFFTGTLFIAPFAEPNVLTALAAVATVGFLVRSGRPTSRRWDLVGLAVALGLMALLRPTDAVFLAGPLGAAVVLTRRWRHLGQVVAILAGLAAGGVAWVIEAFARFGGPSQRLTAMRGVTDAGGPPVILYQLETVTEWLDVSPARAAAAVLVALLVVGVGAVGAYRSAKSHTLSTWLVTLVAATALIVPYSVLLSWTSSRYLLPALALLAIPVAGVLTAIAQEPPGRARFATTGVVAIALLGYGTTQVSLTREAARESIEVRQLRQTAVAQLAAHGIEPPCLVSGYQAPTFAYTLRCHAGDNLSALPSLNSWRREVERDKRRAEGGHVTFVAVLVGAERTEAVADWPRVRLGDTPLYAYFPPDQD